MSPVVANRFETVKLLVVTNGIVSVSKKNTVLTLFAVIEPSTIRVPTFAVVANTFVVVTEFETYKLPSPVYNTSVAAPATPEETR